MRDPISIFAVSQSPERPQGYSWMFFDFAAGTWNADFVSKGGQFQTYERAIAAAQEWFAAQKCWIVELKVLPDDPPADTDGIVKFEQ